MRTILLAALGGAVMVLAACESTSTQSASMNDGRTVEVGGGQARYSVDVNPPANTNVTTTTTEQPYSLNGEKVPQRVDIPAFVRQATNGGN